MKKAVLFVELIALLLSICLLSSLTSCVGPSESSSGGTSDTADENGNTDGKIGDYVVTIKDSYVTKTSEDTVLVVTYSFTNNAKEAKAMVYTISAKAFQNGVELSNMLSSYGIEGYSFENHNKEIQPGVTIDAQVAYKLSNTTSDVEIEIEEILSFSSDSLKYTLSAKDLFKDFESSSDQPSGGADSGTAADGKIGNYVVNVKEHFVTKTSDEKPLLVVTYTFTNNASESQAMAYTLSNKAFQNGVELESAILFETVEGYDPSLCGKAIQPGTTIDVQYAYLLADEESDVELEIEKFFNIDGPVIKQTLKLK